MISRRGACSVAILAAGLLLSGCGVPDAGDRPVTEGRDWHWHWDRDAGADEASAFMGVAVPEGAAQLRGAVQVNPQEDVYLLSFVTGEKGAEGVAEALHSEEPLRARTAEAVPKAELFGHLGLAEPQTLEGARWAGVCPPCVKDEHRKKVQWIEIHVQALGSDRARVYLQAF
ncbi:hypothetical protein [Streptomyces sp. NPDC046925]|uniref:hypothetical protein n=1 Tax=Streptomyces sp. NPDC046925 TaxID=3155375 RepID=UPI0033E07862